MNKFIGSVLTAVVIAFGFGLFVSHSALAKESDVMEPLEAKSLATYDKLYNGIIYKYEVRRNKAGYQFVNHEADGVVIKYGDGASYHLPAGGEIWIPKKDNVSKLVVHKVKKDDSGLLQGSGVGFPIVECKEGKDPFWECRTK